MNSIIAKMPFKSMEVNECNLPTIVSDYLIYSSYTSN